MRFSIIKIWGKLYISAFSLITLLLLFLCAEPLYVLILLSSALLHELGHIIPLAFFGAKIKRVTIFPFGIDIHADTSRLSYKKDFICTIGGAVFNFAASFISVFAMQMLPSPELLFFALVNLSLGVFNLIPLPFLDGGRALRLAVYDIFDITLADDITRTCDVVSLFAFSALAFLLAAKADFNLSIVFVLVYGIVSMLGKKKALP